MLRGHLLAKLFAGNNWRVNVYATSGSWCPKLCHGPANPTNLRFRSRSGPRQQRALQVSIVCHKFPLAQPLARVVQAVEPKFGTTGLADAGVKMMRVLDKSGRECRRREHRAPSLVYLNEFKGGTWLQVAIMRSPSCQTIRHLSQRPASRKLGRLSIQFAQGESVRNQFVRSRSPGFGEFLPGRQTRVTFSLVFNSVRQKACRKQVCSDMSSISCATSSGSDVSR